MGQEIFDVQYKLQNYSINKYLIILELQPVAMPQWVKYDWSKLQMEGAVPNFVNTLYGLKFMRFY